MFNRIKAFLNLNYYTSPLDEFLSKYKHSHPKLSASQLAEQRKYDRIFALRDESTPPSKQQDVWEQF